MNLTWRQLLYAVLIVSAITQSDRPVAAQQSCGSCAPTRARDPHSVDYRFDDNVPQNVRDAFTSAAQEYHNQYGSLLNLNLDQANGSFLISVDSSVQCGISSAVWTQNQSIRLCPLVASSTNTTVAKTVALHEWGHQAGLGGREDACWGQTVMAPVSWTQNNPTQIQWPDQCTIYYQFTGPAYCQPPVWGCLAGYSWDPFYCSCQASPVLLTLGSNGFRLTGVEGGVNFDLNGDGTVERVSWTSQAGDDAFLWLDRNGDGVVNGGSELFGNVTPLSWTESGPTAPHGFAALAWFDAVENGGDADGSINRRDAVFDSLRLWRDSNHDGVSQQQEILGMDDAGVEEISLRVVESRRRDQFGNLFRYRTHVLFVTNRGEHVRRPAYDVFLMTR